MNRKAEILTKDPRREGFASAEEAAVSRFVAGNDYEALL
jgi:hypothetical protein